MGMVMSHANEIVDEHTGSDIYLRSAVYRHGDCGGGVSIRTVREEEFLRITSISQYNGVRRKRNRAGVARLDLSHSSKLRNTDDLGP